MRLCKVKYRDRDGAVHQADKWYLQFRDHRGVVRRVAALKDRSASMELGRKLERLVELRSVDEGPSPELVKWIEGMPAVLRASLVRFKVLDASLAENTLAVLLDDYTATLRARGRTPDWIAHVHARLDRMFTACGFVALSQLNAGGIERHLHALRTGTAPMPAATDSKSGRPLLGKISSRESNHRLQACRGFVRWAMQRGLLQRDPLISLTPVNARVAPVLVRRALRFEELRKLVQTAHDGPVYRGVEGPVRALVWRLAAEAGLRVGEITALQARDVDLEGKGGPALVLRAATTKNRNDARLPLGADLAAALAPHVRGKLPLASLLPLPAWFRLKAPRWLRFDMERAKIAYEDDEGRVADVHALRSAFVACLVRSGANVKAVQRLARHASAEMTFAIYARLDARDEREAIEGLPSLAPVTARAARSP